MAPRSVGRGCMTASHPFQLFHRPLLLIVRAKIDPDGFGADKASVFYAAHHHPHLVPILRQRALLWVPLGNHHPTPYTPHTVSEERDARIPGDPQAGEERMLRPLYWEGGTLRLLDQTRLPEEEVWLTLRAWQEVAEAIRGMRVRGAPAIGIAAAYGLALALWSLPAGADAKRAFQEAAQGLGETRPTAVNLFWAISRMERVFSTHQDGGLPRLREALLAEAQKIHAEDVAANRRLGAFGAALLPPRARLLTICNTGALATGGYGTALGVVRSAWEQGKLELVYVCETRPRLQGARLTAWELLRDGIPFKLIADSAAGWLLAQGEVHAVVVGADRIARNGDTANKIGTYTLAVLAQRHQVPFYVVAPTSTVDLDLESGEGIPIEERGEDEVLAPYGCRLAPPGTRAWNPAFDVTPAELITAIVTERGVIKPPYHETIPQSLA